ncbi:hypothetical protein [Pseudoalteromonas luteoviolacea]|uniref:Uncharacterized protein n=1 Tax=Pseudoalteromonas luteoviolacea NCIMB 1942 TaxID=1365253 RepID=A0A166ZW08_9GAMM|nr:hypothetical protein [Pseudoalteromonas luteoviolacea]KZN44725.1 hypothetical protein N482_16165 [Pseudoalteromonas luteoviolacea NCIMB 1942]
MMQLLKFIVFGAAIFLVGCATSHIGFDYSVAEDGRRGVVWGTITYDDQFAEYQLHYKNNQTGEVGFIKSELVNLEGGKGGVVCYCSSIRVLYPYGLESEHTI